MKIVINDCRGAFDLSEKAVIVYAKKKSLSLFVKRELVENIYFTKAKAERKTPEDGQWFVSSIPRNDLDLVEIVRELGTEANSIYSRLKIVEVVDDYTIVCDDGLETIQQQNYANV